VLSNKNLGALGSDCGLDKHLIKNMGLFQVSKASMANAVEAIHGAAYIDAGDNGLSVVRSMMEHLNLTTHPLLTVTLCDTPPSAF
jgi:dsRNA-specific ribonuclease